MSEKIKLHKMCEVVPSPRRVSKSIRTLRGKKGHWEIEIRCPKDIVPPEEQKNIKSLQEELDKKKYKTGKETANAIIKMFHKDNVGFYTYGLLGEKWEDYYKRTTGKSWKAYLKKQQQKL